MPLPPLPEQQRIVGILDEAFEGIATAKANAEKNLQNARALFESYLQSVFTQRGKGGWKMEPFEECIRKVTSHAKDSEEGLSLLRPYTQSFPKRRRSSTAIGIIENDLFKVTIPVVVFGDSYQGSKICGLRLRAGCRRSEDFAAAEFLLPKFFYYQLQTANLDSLAYARHYRLLKELEIAYPPLPEQRQIVAKLDAIVAETQRLESIYRQKLAALDALKKSLLHQAFSGQL